jgi:two-component system chemotaxis sensor kinase CheA
MDDFEKELKGGFLEEAAQLLADTEQCFLDLETNSGDSSILEKIFRLAHNLKGSARAVGFGEMGEFTHQLESLLLKLKNGELKIKTSTVSLLLKCNDHLRNWVEELKNNYEATADSVALLASIAAQLAGQDDDQSSEPANEVTASEPVAEEVQDEPTPEEFNEAVELLKTAGMFEQTSEAPQNDNVLTMPFLERSLQTPSRPQPNRPLRLRQERDILPPPLPMDRLPPKKIFALV